MSTGKKAILLATIILLIDQAVKIWIKTNMYIGEEHMVLGEWFRIRFTENNGMAFGIQFGGVYGKILLSLFRVAAVSGIGWYISRLIKDRAPNGVIIGLTLIMAGALGNIIDSTFYGMIFSDSNDWMKIAEFLPPEGGYKPIFQGKVVDMIYFPLFEGRLPLWFPFWKGETIQFFRPIFNIADSAITIGVGYLLLFQRTFFKNI